MLKFHKITMFLAAAVLLAQPLFAGQAMLIPQGSVKFVESGAVVDKEIPAPAGMLMACNGQCYIEANGLQLMGADKTVFAVHEESNRFSVMVEKGSVDFAMSQAAKPVEFKTPFDTLDAKPYLVPAGTDSVVRGNLQVTDEKAVLTLTQGSLELTNSDGQKLLHAGNAIVLAQANVASGATATTTTVSTGGALVAGAGAIGMATAVGTTEANKDNNDASPF